jgi:hypothetical protein
MSLLITAGGGGVADLVVADAMVAVAVAVAVALDLELPRQCRFRRRMEAARRPLFLVSLHEDTTHDIELKQRILQPVCSSLRGYL